MKILFLVNLFMSVIGFRLHHLTNPVSFSFSLAMSQPKNMTYLNIRIFEDIPLLKTYKRKETTEKKAPVWLTKTTALVNMTRPINIVPTALLNIMGGFLVDPHLFSLFTNRRFLSMMIVTQLVTAASMVINDWYDVEADRLNHPERPLPAGNVTLREAFALFCALMATAFCITCYQLSQILPWVLTDMVMITLYTPVFKKIPLVKNAICAWVVSSSLWVSGQSTDVTLHAKESILMTASLCLLFTYSLYTEILLDMTDREGDQIQGVRTLPVMFGNRGSLIAGFSILSLGTVITILKLGLLWPWVSLFVVGIWTRSWNRALWVRQREFSSFVLRDVSRETNWFLGAFFVLLFFVKSVR